MIVSPETKTNSESHPSGHESDEKIETCMELGSKDAGRQESKTASLQLKGSLDQRENRKPGTVPSDIVATSETLSVCREQMTDGLGWRMTDGMW